MRTHYFKPGAHYISIRRCGAASKPGDTETGQVLAAYVPGGQEGAFEAFARASAGERNTVAEEYHSEFVEDLP